MVIIPTLQLFTYNSHLKDYDCQCKAWLYIWPSTGSLQNLPQSETPDYQNWGNFRNLNRPEEQDLVLAQRNVVLLCLFCSKLSHCSRFQNLLIWIIYLYLLHEYNWHQQYAISLFCFKLLGTLCPCISVNLCHVTLLL